MGSGFGIGLGGCSGHVQDLILKWLQAGSEVGVGLVLGWALDWYRVGLGLVQGLFRVGLRLVWLEKGGFRFGSGCVQGLVRVGLRLV